MHRTSRLYLTERARGRVRSGVSTAGVGILRVAERSVGMVYLTRSQARRAQATVGWLFLD